MQELEKYSRTEYSKDFNQFCKQEKSLEKLSILKLKLSEGKNKALDENGLNEVVLSRCIHRVTQSIKKSNLPNTSRI